MCMELTGYNQILLLGIMMLLKVRTCGEVWMPSFLPCMPISVKLEDWWSLSSYSWRINSAFHLKYSSFFILYCLYGFDFLGEYRWGQGKPRKQSYCKCLRRRSLENNMSPMPNASGEEALKTTWVQCSLLHRSPHGGVGLGPTDIPFTPAVTAILLIWLSPSAGNLLYCFLKSDVFKGNIYPQSSLTCDDSINCRLARKTNLLQGI